MKNRNGVIHGALYYAVSPCSFEKLFESLTIHAFYDNNKKQILKISFNSYYTEYLLVPPAQV